MNELIFTGSILLGDRPVLTMPIFLMMLTLLTTAYWLTAIRDLKECILAVLIPNMENDSVKNSLTVTI